MRTPRRMGTHTGYFFYVSLRSFSLRCDFSQLVVFFLRVAPSCVVAVGLLGTDGISFTFRSVLSCCGATSRSWLYFFYALLQHGSLS
jgi:hypothetical protein